MPQKLRRILVVTIFIIVFVYQYFINDSNPRNVTPVNVNPVNTHTWPD